MTEETQHWCPVHEKHGEWEHKGARAVGCAIEAYGYLCRLPPIAPDVVEAIRAEGRAEERAAICKWLRDPSAAEAIDRSLAAECIWEGDHHE